MVNKVNIESAIKLVGTFIICNFGNAMNLKNALILFLIIFIIIVIFRVVLF